MGLRETISKNQPAAIALTSVLIVGAIVAIIVQARDFSPSARPGDVYYTNDEGVTTFVDSGALLAPFDKDGKPAYRAHVFECGGKRVVGYMSRYTDDALKAFAEAKAAKGTGKPPANVQQLASIGMTGVEVRKPGAGQKWVRQGDIAKATAIRSFKCPDGSRPPEVFP